MRRSSRLIAFSLVALCAIPLTGASVARSEPAAPSPVASDGVLVQAIVDQLPAPDAEVWFLRAILDPGGTLPPDQQIGPTLVAIESGSVTLIADRTVSVIRAVPGASPTGQPATPDTGWLLEDGDAALVRDGTTISVRNDGKAPAEILSLLLFSPQREVLAGEDEGTAIAQPIGVVFQPLAVGRARFPAGSGVLTIERIAVGTASRVPAGVPNGAEVGTVEQGTIRIDLTSGRLWMMRPTAGGEDEETSEGEVEQVAAGASVEADAGDGYGMSDVVAAWQAAGDAPATVLRARVVPIGVATPTD